MFSSENTKNSYDAKDLLVVICEYKRIYVLPALKICIKLLSTYLTNSKEHLLKNSNTILFFCFKDNIVQTEVVEYLSINSQLIKSILIGLIKKDCTTFEETAQIIDIISCLIIKTDNIIFNSEEIIEIFNKFFSLWERSDVSTESHIGHCLSQLIIKYDYLNNTEFIMKFITHKIKSCVSDNNNSNNYNPSTFNLISKPININNINDSTYKSQSNVNHDIYKYLSLLECYFSNPKLCIIIFKFILNLCCSCFKNHLLSNCSSLYLDKVCDTTISIMNSKYIHNLANTKEYIHIINDFFLEIISRSLINDNYNSDILNFAFGKNKIKKILELIKTILAVDEIDFMHLFQSAIAAIDIVIQSEKLNCLKINSPIINNNKNIEYVNYNENQEECLTFIVYQLKIIKLIVRFNKNISSDFNKTLYNFIDNISQSPITSQHNNIKLYKYNQTVDKLNGMCLYHANILTLKNNDLEQKQIFNNIFNKLNNTFNIIINDIKSSPNESEFKKNLDFFSIVFNYLILAEDKETGIILKNLLENLIFLDNDKIFLTFINSKIFSFDKYLFENCDKLLVLHIIYLVQENNKEDNKYLTSIKHFLLLKLYKNFDEILLEENCITVATICFNAIINKEHIKLSLDLLKSTFKFINKDVFKKININLNSIIENLLIVNKTLK